MRAGLRVRAEFPRSRAGSAPPRVSVIIPAYNVAPFIGETLDSLFRQTYTDFEAIVVDDGSTDELAESLKPYKERIRCLKQPNSGPSAARNAGIASSTGTFIALLDGDDVWMPRFLETLMGRFDSEPDLDVMYPNAEYFGDSPLAGRLHQDVYPPIEPVTFEGLVTGQCHVFGSLIFKRTLLHLVGTFDETLLGGCEDFDMWLRMTQAGARFSFTRASLVMYRRRPNGRSKDPVRPLESQLQMLEKLLVSPVTTEKQRELLLARREATAASVDLALSKECLRSEDYRGAEVRIRRANRHFRSTKLRIVALAIKIAPRVVRHYTVR